MEKVTVVRDISEEEFYKSFVNKGLPVVIKGIVGKWHASNKWNLDYFSSIGKNLDVNVKKGDIAKGNRDTIKLNRYCELLKEAQNSGVSKLPYLHDIPMFHLLPELVKDIDNFPLKFFPKWYRNEWWNYVQFFMGDKNSLTPMHFDTLFTHNLFFQVVGNKKFYLIPHDHGKYCYLNNWRWSPVDAENPNYEAYPLFKKARCMSVLLKAGDILYLPPGTLHQVRGLSFSISFNIDWHTRNSVKKGLFSFLKGAPAANIYYNSLIAMGLLLKAPSRYILPLYRSYLNYIS